MPCGDSEQGLHMERGVHGERASLPLARALGAEVRLHVCESHHHPFTLPRTYRALAPATHPRKSATLAPPVSEGPPSPTHDENEKVTTQVAEPSSCRTQCSPSLMHSVSKHFLSIYCMPGPVL